jgi:hypothetical protein
MKKSVTIVAAVMAGVVGFGGTAFATDHLNWIPSRTVRDMTTVATTAATFVADNGSDNPEADSYAKLMTEQYNDEYQAAVDFANTFDVNNIDDAADAAIFNIIDGEEAVCHEVVPFVFSSYDGGALNVKATFPTDYNYLLCTKVAVLISVKNGDEITNYVVEGTITDQGVVQFHIDGNCAAAVADGTAFIAIFSAE